MPHPKGFLLAVTPLVEMTKMVSIIWEVRNERTYYVYILASETGTLYVGITSSLEGRMGQHKSGLIKGFTQKYKAKKLLYYEEFYDVYQAITREKEIKKWRRGKKIALFESSNPGWTDLSKDWFND